ncbi:MAG TPA: hypothetical protein VE860_10030, partial [Chthoniobacterales bacterium]|nr:hypothetical protein [Chthoniobacterales bacterium]
MDLRFIPEPIRSLVCYVCPLRVVWEDEPYLDRLIWLRLGCDMNESVIALTSRSIPRFQHYLHICNTTFKSAPERAVWIWDL